MQIARQRMWMPRRNLELTEQASFPFSPPAQRKLFASNINDDPKRVAANNDWHTGGGRIGTSTSLWMVWNEPDEKASLPHPLTKHLCPIKLVTGKHAVVIAGDWPNGTATANRNMATSFTKFILL